MSYYIERESADDFLPYEIPKETDGDSKLKKVIRYFQKQTPENINQRFCL